MRRNIEIGDVVFTPNSKQKAIAIGKSGGLVRVWYHPDGGVADFEERSLAPAPPFGIRRWLGRVSRKFRYLAVLLSFLGGF